MKGLLGSHDIQSLVSVNETAVFVCERGVTHRFQQKKEIYRCVSKMGVRERITVALEFQTFDHKALEAEARSV
jgi:hypothetical protein